MWLPYLDEYMYSFPILGLLAAAFWIWMIVDCARHEEGRGAWLWIVILLNLPGAIIYFLCRKLPAGRWRTPAFLRRWSRRKEVWQARQDARNIGNAYHFVRLGDVLRETGRHGEASQAYAQALEMEPEDPDALWGAAAVDMKAERFDQARTRLEKLLALEPNFKFGDAPKAYVRTLLAQGDLETAEPEARRCARRWADAESQVLLAQVQLALGRPAEARATLEALLDDLKHNPAGNTRADRRWKWQAHLLLRRCK